MLRELAEMTPGPYLHIGGDEAHSTSREDYLAFMERVQPIVAGLGKRLVGWEEIATAPLDANAIVQYWHTGPAEGVELIQRAAAGGAQVILSPGKHIYLDQKYDEDTELGLTWAGYVELRDAYEWEPSELIPGWRTCSASKLACGARRSRTARSSRRSCSPGSPPRPRSPGRRPSGATGRTSAGAWPRSRAAGRPSTGLRRSTGPDSL